MKDTKQEAPKTAEEYFNLTAYHHMISYDLDGFKRTHPTLFKTILIAMEHYASQFKSVPQSAGVIREALRKITEMQLTPEEEKTHNYKYAFNRCWHLAKDALDKEALGGQDAGQDEAK